MIRKGIFLHFVDNNSTIFIGIFYYFRNVAMENIDLTKIVFFGEQNFSEGPIACISCIVEELCCQLASEHCSILQCHIFPS